MRAPFSSEQLEQLREAAAGLLFIARFHAGDLPLVRHNLAAGTRWVLLAVRETVHDRPAERCYLFSSLAPRLVVSELLTPEEARARLDDLLGRATFIQTGDNLPTRKT